MCVCVCVCLCLFVSLTHPLSSSPKSNKQADMVLLSTSEEDQDCYIETADLDGETNLKKRYAAEPTRGMNTAADLGAIECKPEKEGMTLKCNLHTHAHTHTHTHTHRHTYN